MIGSFRYLKQSLSNGFGSEAQLLLPGIGLFSYPGPSAYETVWPRWQSTLLNGISDAARASFLILPRRSSLFPLLSYCASCMDSSMYRRFGPLLGARASMRNTGASLRLSAPGPSRFFMGQGSGRFDEPEPSFDHSGRAGRPNSPLRPFVPMAISSHRRVTAKADGQHLLRAS